MKISHLIHFYFSYHISFTFSLIRILAEIPWTTNSLDWIEANRKMNGMIVGVFPNHNVKRYRLYLDFYAKHKLEYEESFILLNVTNDSFQTFLDFYNLTAPAGLQSDSKNVSDSPLLTHR